MLPFGGLSPLAREHNFQRLPEIDDRGLSPLAREHTKDILLFIIAFKHTTIYQLYHNNLTLLKNIQLIDFQREGMKPVVGHLNLPVYGGFLPSLKLKT